jgi:hypothetical protein
VYIYLCKLIWKYKSLYYTAECRRIHNTNNKNIEVGLTKRRGSIVSNPAIECVLGYFHDLYWVFCDLSLTSSIPVGSQWIDTLTKEKILLVLRFVHG